MRRIVQSVFFCLALASVCAGQQVVDRIVATVNRQPILLSDWEVEMRYEAMLDHKSLPLSDEVARGALERLIDQELVRQQIRSFRLTEPGTQEVTGRVKELRKDLNAESDATFRALLNRYGIDEGELRDRVATLLLILRFIDMRLRPSVHVERRSIEAYYNDTLAPEIRKTGAEPASLADLSAQIEELLAQQRVEKLTDEWLKDMRQQSQIHVDPAAALAPPSASAKPPDAARP